MTILSKEIYGLDAIPIEISIAFFTELEKYKNVFGNTKDTINGETILRKKKKLEVSQSFTSNSPTKL